MDVNEAGKKDPTNAEQPEKANSPIVSTTSVSYTHLRAHET